MKFHIRLSSFLHALSLSAFTLVMNHIHPLAAALMLHSRPADHT